jgi:sigma-B regulation protein RsbU (phosphoserine phosphatase)
LFPGDSLFLYSDGITEAKNLQGIFYGEERLVQALKKLNHNSLENQTRLFMDQFFSWIENCEVRDDIAFLAMRVK